MVEYDKLRQICDENSRVSSRVIDDFLIYYAAARNNLEKEMNRRFGSVKHITSNFPKEWVNRLKSQYIAHKVFMKDGFIRNYLKNDALKSLKVDERKFLEFQAENPWRFSFSRIKENPAIDFYLMADVFSGDEFLLYSSGVSATNKQQKVILWFNLIAFNGECWQSFGPIAGYNSFEPDDIFLFATELQNDIVDIESILSNIDYNPVPYMMLISGAGMPLIFNNNDQVIIAVAEYDIDSLETGKLTEIFTTEYNKGVYRLLLNGWAEHPHLSQAYFDENNKIIVLTAMTERGFEALSNALNGFGYSFSSQPFLRVNLSMISTASDILKRKIQLNEYEKLFTRKTAPENQAELDRINALLQQAIPDINAGRQPDIRKLADETGMDAEEVKRIIKSITGKLKK